MIRFYAFKQVTDPGTYQIRGQVVSNPQDFLWSASNFAGFFYYDLNEDITTESLRVSGISGRVIPVNGLK